MNSVNSRLYTTKFQAGLGLINETRVLLELWEPGMNRQQLHHLALRSGVFPNITARRLLNIISECFAHRYLTDSGKPALALKELISVLHSSEFQQLLLIYTSRANVILADFIKDVFWERYAGGASEISSDDAKVFVERALDDGKMEKRWTESVIKRVSSYLLGCCSDYGLLENSRGSRRKILPFRIFPKVVVYLAYDLHFRGAGDNAMLEHDDWKLFGLDRNDVLEELKRLALKNVFIVQSAANVVDIGWKFKNMEEVCGVIAKI